MQTLLRRHNDMRRDETTILASYLRGLQAFCHVIYPLFCFMDGMCRLSSIL